MDTALLELYSDSLLSSFGATPATGLSALVDGAVSHDPVTRFLSAADYDTFAKMVPQYMTVWPIANSSVELGLLFFWSPIPVVYDQRLPRGRRIS